LILIQILMRSLLDTDLLARTTQNRRKKLKQLIKARGNNHAIHSHNAKQNITSQEEKIREICRQLGLVYPEVSIKITGLSTKTEIIADESVLEHVEPIYYSDAD
jgi:hypothetical protein